MLYFYHPCIQHLLGATICQTWYWAPGTKLKKIPLRYLEPNWTVPQVAGNPSSVESAQIKACPEEGAVNSVCGVD